MSINKKSQITIEFISIIALGLVITVSFSTFILSELRKGQSSQRYEEILKIASKIQSEMKIASESVEGYNRFFYLPEKVLDKEYYISVKNNSWISIYTIKESFVFNVNYFEGSFNKVVNHIEKRNGIIKLNE